MTDQITWIIPPAELTTAELALFEPHREVCAVLATPGAECTCQPQAVSKAS